MKKTVTYLQKSLHFKQNTIGGKQNEKKQLLDSFERFLKWQAKKRKCDRSR